MAEIKRSLLALQTSDDNKCAMPLDWQPGDKVIVPAPKTPEALAERKKSDMEMEDWYLAKWSLKLTIQILKNEKECRKSVFSFFW